MDLVERIKKRERVDLVKKLKDREKVITSVRQYVREHDCSREQFYGLMKVLETKLYD